MPIQVHYIECRHNECEGRLDSLGSYRSLRRVQYDGDEQYILFWVCDRCKRVYYVSLNVGKDEPIAEIEMKAHFFNTDGIHSLGIVFTAEEIKDNLDKFGKGYTNEYNVDEYTNFLAEKIGKTEVLGRLRVVEVPAVFLEDIIARLNKVMTVVNEPARVSCISDSLDIQQMIQPVISSVQGCLPKK